MRTRIAKPEDREPVMRLLSQVWTDDYVAECWDDWVAEPEQGIPLVAVDQEKVLGVAYVHLLSQRVAWLQALRVHPAARRMGIGTALANASLEQARQAGRSVARLLIDGDNHASASMTGRAGFQMVLRYCKLHKEQLRPDGPKLGQPTAAQLPALLQRAEATDLRYWHSDWETRDLSLSVLEQARQLGSLRVLSDRPTLAVADVIAYDQDFDVTQPVGEPVAVLDLIHGLESEALSLGKPHMDIFLPAVSPSLALLAREAGFQLLQDDGYTIWECTLSD